MSYEYNQYLQNHMRNVSAAYTWIQNNIPELVDGYPTLEWDICYNHDSSKYKQDEYDAYDKYFYGDKSYSVVQEFKRAWLVHIHRNPHHWQHWILNNDNPNEGETILEMPYNYIVEMICDWWSFSHSKGNLYEIFKWYDERKEYIKLHPDTRKVVESILHQIKEKMGGDAKNSSELAHHGIKGQKWGVRNGPPYPLEKSDKNDTIVKDAIESGSVSKKINREKQLRHTKDKHTHGRSYINGDLDYAQQLVDELSGTGKPIKDHNGNWTHQERVESTDVIGVYVNDSYDIETGVETNKAIITYSKTGSHIYPAKRKEQNQ